MGFKLKRHNPEVVLIGRHTALLPHQLRFKVRKEKKYFLIVPLVLAALVAFAMTLPMIWLSWYVLKLRFENKPERYGKLRGVWG